MNEFNSSSDFTKKTDKIAVQELILQFDGIVESVSDSKGGAQISEGVQKMTKGTPEEKNVAMAQLRTVVSKIRDEKANNRNFSGESIAKFSNNRSFLVENNVVFLLVFFFGFICTILFSVVGAILKSIVMVVLGWGIYMALAFPMLYGRLRRSGRPLGWLLVLFFPILSVIFAIYLVATDKERPKESWAEAHFQAPIEEVFSSETQTASSFSDAPNPKVTSPINSPQQSKKKKSFFDFAGGDDRFRR